MLIDIMFNKWYYKNYGRLGGKIMKQYKRCKKYILCVIFILNIFFGISCGNSSNPDETVISRNSGETDTENEQINDILYEIEQLKSENSDIMSELDTLKEELNQIMNQYSILDNSYSEKSDELESAKTENDFLKSENEQMKLEINEADTLITPSVRDTEEPKSEIETISDAGSQAKNTVLYVLNKSTKKFHFSTCGSASSIKPENYAETYDRSYAINNGYDACKKCNP